MNKEIFNFLEFFSSGHYCWTLKLKEKKKEKRCYDCYQLNLIRVDTVWGPSAQPKHSPAYPPLKCQGTRSHIQGTLQAPHTCLQLLPRSWCPGTGGCRGEELCSEVHIQSLASMVVAGSTPCATGFLFDCRQVKKNVAMATVHPVRARSRSGRGYTLSSPQGSPAGKAPELIVPQSPVKLGNKKFRKMRSPNMKEKCLSENH